MHKLSPIEFKLLSLLSEHDKGLSTDDFVNEFDESVMSLLFNLQKEDFLLLSDASPTKKDNWKLTDKGRAMILNKDSTDKLEKEIAIKDWFIGFLTGIIVSIIGMIVRYLLFN